MQLPSSVSTRLQYQHKSLLDLIDDLSDEQVRQHIIPGKWSIFENIVHLETYQHRFIERVKLILQNTTPVFERYIADTDPLFIEHCGKSTREVMQHLLSTRKEMAAEILSFQEADFSKSAVHLTFGKMNLVQWLNFFLLHEAHHLFTILKLAGQIRKESA
jgi:uncharacterized damage-inducible protein DinB